MLARHVWMAPGWQGFFRAFGSAASCGHVCGLVARHAWPLALMGTVDRDPIIAAGSQCPDDAGRLPSIAGLTDIAITRVHPRKPSVVASSFTSHGSCLARLLFKSDVAPFTSSRRK